MLEGLYSAASGLAAQQTRLDAVSNDLANANTTGYKAVRVAYRDLAYDQPGYGAQGEAQTGAGAAASFVGRDWAQGPVQATERPLDVALNGPGYLRVLRPDGTEGLTRDGQLQTDAQGRLTSPRGELLQPPVTLPAGTDPAGIKIGPDGTVTANGTVAGRLQVVDVPNPDGLVPLGANSFLASAASGAATPAAGTTLAQGSLEGSGTDVAVAMTDMMEAQRAFQLVSKAIKVRDDVWAIANQVKR